MRRDPMRVGRITEKLRIIWEVKRWSRLGQLLMNLSRAAHGGAPDTSVELWHREDTEWELLLNNEIDRLENGVVDNSGVVRYLDRGRMVTKDELYED